MMWIADLFWAIGRVLAFIMQLTGAVGVIAGIAILIYRLNERLLEEAEKHEDSIRRGEEDQSLQS